MVKAIVLRQAGTNCDAETRFALEKAGFSVDDVHVNELINGSKKLVTYNLLAIPGGFSAGDYLGSGKVFANKILYKLNNEVPQFIGRGNLVIGICNGFQVLVKAGLLPGFEKNYKEQNISITINDPLGFRCDWVKLKNQGANCAFTKGIETLNVPIAHAEGRFYPGNKEVLEKLYEKNQVVFKYEKNPNGSVDDIAGICDETGKVFGLMPHPERNLFGINAPNSSFGKVEENGEGLKIFENAFNYLKK